MPTQKYEVSQKMRPNTDDLLPEEIKPGGIIPHSTADLPNEIFPHDWTEFLINNCKFRARFRLDGKPFRGRKVQVEQFIRHEEVSGSSTKFHTIWGDTFVIPWHTFETLIDSNNRYKVFQKMVDSAMVGEIAEMESTLHRRYLEILKDKGFSEDQTKRDPSNDLTPIGVYDASSLETRLAQQQLQGKDPQPPEQSE